MTLPSSGAISLGQVNTELGLSATASISLGATNVRALASVPSGPISFGDLRGKSAMSFSTPTARLTNTSAAAGLRSGRIQFNTDGTLTLTSGSGSSAWWSTVHAGIGSSYWVKVTVSGVTSSSYPGGMTPGTWYQLTSAQSMTFQNSSSTAEGTGTGSVYFSTAGTDASIVASFTGAISWDVGQTH